MYSTILHSLYMFITCIRKPGKQRTLGRFEYIHTYHILDIYIIYYMSVNISQPWALSPPGFNRRNVILMFGPPASGKGTQGGRISKVLPLDLKHRVSVSHSFPMFSVFGFRLATSCLLNSKSDCIILSS